ncbi:hypothetical protein [Streptomyces sp. CBMA152]|uniref:hypothetical protein n=1 Tax=Streptomyces sp. CBMA152 TaxID=1896312 RepID=UPI001660C185|nr:hypothetical protein [Streptomyces sp. CBMA152]MBD0745630.1 hypothetical protein [Streptomyces sp. CBMA152]
MNSRSVRRTCVSLVAAGAALAGVAACGSGSGSGSAAPAKEQHKAGSDFSPVAALQAVQKKTDGAGSSKVEVTMSMGTTMGLQGAGDLAWGGGMTGTMRMKYTQGTMAQTMKQIGAESIDARYLRDAYFANMGPTFAQSVGGKHWIRYGYDDMAKLMGPSGAVMKDQMQNSTPQQGVKMLLASGDVKKVGTEDVRGVQATHYSGTVDIAKLVGSSSGLDAKTLDAFKAQMTQSGISTDTVDIWVDKDDLLVKKTERAATKNGELNTTAFYSDYGVKVAVEAPPAADTLDFTTLIKPKTPTQQQG